MPFIVLLQIWLFYRNKPRCVRSIQDTLRTLLIVSLTTVAPWSGPQSYAGNRISLVIQETESAVVCCRPFILFLRFEADSGCQWDVDLITGLFTVSWTDIGNREHLQLYVLRHRAKCLQNATRSWYTTNLVIR